MYHVLLLAVSLIAAGAAPAAAHPAASAACSASGVLNAVGDALTSGKDANVLRAALAGERAFTACGDLHDAIGAQLIAADAYGDTNQPAARCAALRSAAARATHLGETERARTIAHASADCLAH